MGDISLRAVDPHGGRQPHVQTEGWGGGTAQKGDVIGRLLMLAQRGRIKVAPDLPGPMLSRKSCGPSN